MSDTRSIPRDQPVPAGEPVEPAEPVEHLDVLIVGAGLSGIGAAHRLQTECPWARYAIVEARDAIGGTWDLFRYPGIRSDSDMHTLGYPFRPWTGEQSIADGASILQYIRDTAAEAGIDQRIRFGHRIVRAEWSSDDARWTVTAERVRPGTGEPEPVELTCSFLFSCSGYYRYDRGHEPDIAGADRFGGTVVHPQFWPDDLDVDGKEVVVIGSGATAITLIPSLAAAGAHVTMLQRSPTYVASLPQSSPVAATARRFLPERFAAPLIRWFHALATQASYQLSRRRPKLMKRLLLTGIARELPDDFDVATHFTPRYDPWDQRLCVVPDGDLFRAIRAGTATVVTDHVESFTETGLALTSGAPLDADVVVTATGLEMLFLGGIELIVDGEKVDVAEKLTYKGMMLEDVPNLALAVGYTNASWTLKSDLTATYVCRLLNRLHTTELSSFRPVNTDPTLEHLPLMGLSSGYITRAAGEFPKQGGRFPWQVHQSYLRDYRAMTLSDLDDDAMVFS